MLDLPRTTTTGRSYLRRFAAATIHVYRDPGMPNRPGAAVSRPAVSRPALDRLRNDGLIKLGDYIPLHGRPIVVTDLGRAVLAAHPNET